MKLFVALPLLLSVSSSRQYVPIPAPYSDHCRVSSKTTVHKREKRTNVPWYDVDLDAPAFDRWRRISADYKREIADLANVIKQITIPYFHHRMIMWVDKHLAGWDKRLPQPYADELKGIANATGLPLGEVVLYNIFYEIFTVCTSVVAEDDHGQLYHARNLDFGIFMGWNATTHDWIMTEKLRRMIVNVNWHKGGRLLFRSNNFAGFVGVYNAVKPNKFTVTANQRFNLDGGYIGLLLWLLRLAPDSKWMTWHVREVMEVEESYESAVRNLTSQRILAPVYYIVGGNSSGQGVLITRSRTRTLEQTPLRIGAKHGWYILQTNYDQRSAPLYLDNRRRAGHGCMRRLGRRRADLDGILEVLSSTTTLNKLTVYTALMQVDNGTLETHIQRCAQPCYPW